MTEAPIVSIISGRSLSSRLRTSSVALAISCWNKFRGISLRRPSCSARIELPSARLTMCSSPGLEKLAPLLPASELTTALSPRATRTSVTDFADRLAPGDRQHVRLALAPGIGDERLVVELCRLLEHRPCDLDRVVEGELVDDIDRRGVVHARAVRKAAPGPRPRSRPRAGRSPCRRSAPLLRCSCPRSEDRSHATARARGSRPCRAGSPRRDPVNMISSAPYSNLQARQISRQARDRLQSITSGCDDSVKLEPGYCAQIPLNWGRIRLRPGNAERIVRGLDPRDCEKPGGFAPVRGQRRQTKVLATRLMHEIVTSIEGADRKAVSTCIGHPFLGFLR